MKIVVFQGGLGNQLFQYAFYRYLEQQCDIKRLCYIFVGNAHNGFEVDKYFETSLRPANKLWTLLWWFSDKLHKRGIRFLTSYEDDECPTARLFVEGYWQHRRYLHPNLIRFKDIPLDNRNLEIIEQMKDCESVSIHIRRGDYMLPYFHRIYGDVCTLAYYQKAIEVVRKQLPQARFFIFSDDIEWTRNNLIVERAVCIDWNVGEKSVIDMYMMTYCKANIIANSSFSYWGARLNVNDHPLVVYPKKWFNAVFTAPDIFPNIWIGL